VRDETWLSCHLLIGLFGEDLFRGVEDALEQPPRTLHIILRQVDRR
jgi:hypothetical protein